MARARVRVSRMARGSRLTRARARVSRMARAQVSRMARAQVSRMARARVSRKVRVSRKQEPGIRRWTYGGFLAKSVGDA